MEKGARFIVIEYIDRNLGVHLVKGAVLGNGDIISYPYELEEVFNVYKVSQPQYFSAIEVGRYISSSLSLDSYLNVKPKEHLVEIISRHSIKKIILTTKYVDYNI